MTDFFARLAERTLGLASVVQPITASMFEPEKGRAVQEDTLEIALEEEAQIEVANRPVGRPDTNALPSFDKSEEEPNAGTLQQFEASMRGPAVNGLPELSQPAGAPHASRNALLPGKYSAPKSPGQQGAPGTFTGENPEDIPPASSLSSPVNEVLIYSEHSISYRDHRERGAAQPSGATDIRAPGFPGTRPTSSPTTSTPAMPVVPGISTRQIASYTPVAPSQQVAEIGQHSAADYARTHTAPEHPGTKAGDTHQVIVETRIMQPSSAAKAVHPEQAPLPNAQKRPSPDPPASSRPTPARPASEPAIQVTIGRIEVRATPPPSPPVPPQHQRSAPAAMSLDDYLRQSARGGR